jgi:hypothetical protein
MTDVPELPNETHNSLIFDNEANNRFPCVICGEYMRLSRLYSCASLPKTTKKVYCFKCCLKTCPDHNDKEIPRCPCCNGYVRSCYNGFICDDYVSTSFQTSTYLMD